MLFDTVATLCRICWEKGVHSAILSQSVKDGQQLSLVGVGVQKVNGLIQTAIELLFPSFTIFTKSIDDRSQDLNESHDAPNAANTLKVCKDVEKNDSDDYQRMKTATCDLVLQGDNFSNKHSPYTAYYACVPGNFVFQEKSFGELTKRQFENVDYAVQARELYSKADCTNYYLQFPATEKSLSLRSAPIWSNYSYFTQRGSDEAATSINWFLNDSALLEIEGRELLMNEEMIISLSDIMSAVSEVDGTTIGEILPINGPETLIAMAEKHVRVKVGAVSGYMILPRIRIKLGEFQRDLTECGQQNHEQPTKEDTGTQHNFNNNQQFSEPPFENQHMLAHIQFVLDTE